MGRRVKPADRVGDNYVPHFDFSHLPDADYEAVIDALQSQGTGTFKVATSLAP